MGRLERRFQPPGRADALPYPQETDKPEGLSLHVLKQGEGVTEHVNEYIALLAYINLC